MKTRLFISALALLALLTLSACEKPPAEPIATVDSTPEGLTPPVEQTIPVEQSTPPATPLPTEVAAEAEWSSPLIKYMIECAYLGITSSYDPLAEELLDTWSPEGVEEYAGYLDLFKLLSEATGNAWNSEGEEGYAEYLDLFYEIVDKEELSISESFLNNIRAITTFQPYSDDYCMIKFEYYNEFLGGTEHTTFFPGWFTVKTLEDFRYMPNLEKLELRYTSFSDLTPLESLSRLNTFCIGSIWHGDTGESVFTDLIPLTRCPELKSLKLDCANIDDLSALSQLSNLTLLQLSNFNGQDMEFLSGMSSLEELVLYTGENLDLGALVKYAPPSLKSLGTGRCGIKDITALGNLTQLEELSLGANLICDISPLRTLTNLKILRLTNNQISDISPLAGLYNLVELHLNRNQIEDISALAGMENLVMLNLDDNNITDFSLLYRLEKLETLYVYDPEHEEFILEWKRRKGQTLN